jgi:acetyl esterase/lipase
MSRNHIKPWRAVQPYIQLNTLLWRASVATLIHRIRNGPRRAGWSQQFEMIVQMLALGLPGVTEFEAEVIRTPLDRLTRLMTPHRIHIEPTNAGGVLGEWLSIPKTGSAAVVLFLHGGGYISGSPQTHRLLTTQIARAAPARVLAIDYRLAPEHPSPAAVEDAWRAYWWLLTQRVAPQKIVVAGDSAGGGLAIALLLALRDAGLPLPAGAVCLSPWFDLLLEGASVRDNPGVDYLNEQVLRGCAQMYLAGADPRSPLASPLYADLHGLPPLLLQASTTELLVDDSRRFAARARAAGVDVDMQLWDDLVHVWHFFYLIAAEAQQAIERIGVFVREQTGEDASNGEEVANHPGRYHTPIC